jgi:RNA polymerase sigma-70 factor, ECF subfamily
VSQGFQTCTDNELVTKIVEGQSEAASSELFRRYRKKIYIWCFHITHDRDDAVDLTQEIFIRIFRGLAGFDGRARFSTWVFRITRNHCLSVVGTKKDQWRKNLAELDGVEVQDNSFVRSLRQAEVSGEVEQFLAHAGPLMKTNELEAFVLHFRDGLPVKEISRILGCTNASGARTLIQNASRKFRRMVSRKGRFDD